MNFELDKPHKRCSNATVMVKKCSFDGNSVSVRNNVRHHGNGVAAHLISKYHNHNSVTKIPGHNNYKTTFEECSFNNNRLFLQDPGMQSTSLLAATTC